MAKIAGTNSSERLYGFDTNDAIYGYGGNDVLYGYGGADVLYGGAGNDVLYGGAGDDDLFGGTGTNSLFGGTGRDFFVVGARSSAASTNTIRDFDFDLDKIDVAAWGVSDFSQVKILLGTASNGSATLNATFSGVSNVLQVAGVAKAELEASDFAYSTAAAQSIRGTNAADTLFGSRGADDIRGNGGNDRLLGGVGDDDLFGGAGNDQLWGGAGSDLLAGDAGADSFAFFSVSDMTSKSGRDVILDFQTDLDVIDFSNLDADATVRGNQAFDWVGRTAFSDSGQLRYAYDARSDVTVVYGNTDNDNSAEFALNIDGRYGLIADDFYV